MLKLDCAVLSGVGGVGGGGLSKGLCCGGDPVFCLAGVEGGGLSKGLCCGGDPVVCLAGVEGGGLSRGLCCGGDPVVCLAGVEGDGLSRPADVGVCCRLGCDVASLRLFLKAGCVRRSRKPTCEGVCCGNSGLRLASDGGLECCVGLVE